MGENPISNEIRAQKLISSSYLITIMSNQAGLALKSDSKAPKAHQSRLTAFKAKVSAVFSQLNIPMNIYAATDKDLYRKPRTGMWKELLEDNDLSLDSIDLEHSFFIGDAGGRIAADGLSKDFSSSDRYACLSTCPSVLFYSDH